MYSLRNFFHVALVLFGQLSFGVVCLAATRQVTERSGGASPSSAVVHTVDATGSVSQLIGASIQSNVIRASFVGSSGCTFRLERMASLTDTTWQSISGVLDATPADSQPVFIDDPSMTNVDQAVYRVRLICSYTLSVTGQVGQTWNVTSQGGARVATVTASPCCSWTPFTSKTWIQISSTATQTGDGYFTISVDSLSHALPNRTGTVVLMAPDGTTGARLTINQSANP